MKLIDIEPIVQTLEDDSKELPTGGTTSYERGYNEGWRAAVAHLAFVLKLMPSVIPEAKDEKKKTEIVPL